MSKFFNEQDHDEMIAVAEREKRETEERERQAYLATQRKNREAAIKQAMPVWEGIVAAVPTALHPSTGKHTAEIVQNPDAWPSLMIDGVDAQFVLNVENEFKRVSSWRTERTNKLRVVAGGVGHRQSFPQRKDGTFNYERIAQILLTWATDKKHRTRIETARVTNRSAAEAVSTELKVNSVYGAFQVSPSINNDKPVFVKVLIERAMTAAETVKLHQTLKELGLI